MMHQICYSFLKYLEIVEIEPKYCFFGSFYTLRDTPQDIKFHPYRISLKTKISAKTASIGIINNIYSRSQKNHRSLQKLSGKSFFEPKLGLLCHNGSKSYSQILTQPIIGPLIYTFQMSSFRFWVFTIFDINKKNPLYFFGSGPILAHF